MQISQKSEAVSLLLSCFPDKWLPLFSSSQQAETILSRHIDLRQSLQIEKQEQLAGLLGYSYHGRSFLNLPVSALAAPVHPRQFYLEILCTAPDLRCQGISTTLLRQAHLLASGCHAQELALDVACNNLPAIRLYQRAGFRLASRRRAAFPLQHFSFFRMTAPVNPVMKQI